MPRKKHKIKCAFPYPIQNAEELLNYCNTLNKSISEVVFENEKAMRTEEEIHNELMRIWNTMLECMYIGCHSEGILPGGLNVRRRAFDMHQNLIGELPYNSLKNG
jgi:L-serine dehydratase